MSPILRGSDVPDHSAMLPLVKLPIQRKLPCGLGFNQGYQYMTCLSNLPWFQVPVPDTFNRARSSQPTSHTLLASDLREARDLCLGLGLPLRVLLSCGTHLSRGGRTCKYSSMPLSTLASNRRQQYRLYDDRVNLRPAYAYCVLSFVTLSHF